MNNGHNILQQAGSSLRVGQRKSRYSNDGVTVVGGSIILRLTVSAVEAAVIVISVEDEGVSF